MEPQVSYKKTAGRPQYGPPLGAELWQYMTRYDTIWQEMALDMTVSYDASKGEGAAPLGHVCPLMTASPVGHYQH